MTYEQIYAAQALKQALLKARAYPLYQPRFRQ